MIVLEISLRALLGRNNECNPLNDVEENARAGNWFSMDYYSWYFRSAVARAIPKWFPMERLLLHLQRMSTIHNFCGCETVNKGLQCEKWSDYITCSSNELSRKKKICTQRVTCINYVCFNYTLQENIFCRAKSTWI